MNNNNSIIIGRSQDKHLKDLFEIFEDIERLVCISGNPRDPLEFIILNCYKLWDMHNQIRNLEIEKIILEIKLKKG